MLDHVLPASGLAPDRERAVRLGDAAELQPASKHAFAQLPRVLNAAAASANIDCICDWAGSFEEIDVVPNDRQDLALEAV
jgi:hypothetical protein